MAVVKRGVKKKIVGTSTEKVLIQNFVGLQKVMVNLATKFDDLSSEISNLLNLFEISAKALAEKGIEIPENKRIIEKLDNISEQNKVVARGVTLMHQAYLKGPQQTQQPISQLPSQQVPQNRPPAPQNTSMQGYQRSISSRRQQ